MAYVKLPVFLCDIYAHQYRSTRVGGIITHQDGACVSKEIKECDCYDEMRFAGFYRPVRGIDDARFMCTVMFLVRLRVFRPLSLISARILCAPLSIPDNGCTRLWLFLTTAWPST